MNLTAQLWGVIYGNQPVTNTQAYAWRKNRYLQANGYQADVMIKILPQESQKR